MNPELVRLHPGPRLSEAAIFQHTVHLAGQVADQKPDADITGQTLEVLGHVERLLLEANSSKSHILHCQIYLRNIADIEAMNAVWDAWIPDGHAPPRATVQAVLANPKWLIEVVVVAAVAG